MGTGFYGSVLAERIASELGERVLMIDLRQHIGGNSFSYRDPETQIEVHKYGSHIFHTSNEQVWTYLNRFTRFNSYRHRVMTTHKGRVYTMPMNLLTINSFFGTAMGPEEAKRFLAEEIAREANANPANLEEKAISLIGRRLYDAFIKGYTQKQWETPLTELPANIITRLPVRYNYNDYYFNDTYEGIPVDGYGAIFHKMLNHPKIEVKLGVDYFAIRDQVPASCTVIYTGPIDRYFDYRHGHLGWRTVDLEEQRLATSDFQGCSVMNYPDLDQRFTRIHEFRHYHPERKQSDTHTLIYKEYSRMANRPDDVPYYPINTERDKKVFSQYREMGQALENVILGGRLGNYVYIDMHQAIAMALNTFNTRILPAARAGARVAPASTLSEAR